MAQAIYKNTAWLIDGEPYVCEPDDHNARGWRIITMQALLSMRCGTVRLWHPSHTPENLVMLLPALLAEDEKWMVMHVADVPDSFQRACNFRATVPKEALRFAWSTEQNETRLGHPGEQSNSPPHATCLVPHVVKELFRISSGTRVQRHTFRPRMANSQWQGPPTETCHHCGTDPRNVVHQMGGQSVTPDENRRTEEKKLHIARERNKAVAQHYTKLGIVRIVKGDGDEFVMTVHEAYAVAASDVLCVVGRVLGVGGLTEPLGVDVHFAHLLTAGTVAMEVVEHWLAKERNAALKANAHWDPHQ